eukprot:jgi/Mesen1/9678/ME000680S09087
MAVCNDERSTIRRPVEVKREDFLYTSFYCEENAYMLCRRLPELGLAAADASDLLVVFISNAARQVPLWRQRAAQGGADAGGFVLWDYHVICIQFNSGPEKSTLVWDLDATIDFPARLDEYCAHVLYNGQMAAWRLSPQYMRMMRVVRAPLFLCHFASDRSHMRDAATGQWLQPSPPHDCIEYISMPKRSSEQFGVLSSRSRLRDPLGMLKQKQKQEQKKQNRVRC